MSEQPVTPSYNISPDELAAWETLAIESAEWPDHPGVNMFKKNHLERVLAERGFEHLINKYLVVNEDGLTKNPLASPKSTTLQSHNLYSVASEAAPKRSSEKENRDDIGKSFEKAEGTLIRIIDSPEFEEYCNSFGDQHGIEVPNDTTDPIYWAVVKAYTQSRRQQLEASGKVSEQFLDGLALLSSTPGAIFAQKQLDVMRAGGKSFRFSNLSPQEQEVFLASKIVVSEYNTLIRELAQMNPDVYVDDLVATTEQMMDLAFPLDEHKAIGDSIDAVMRGAQHEVAFGQVLQQLKELYGFDFRPSTVQEDIGEGDGNKHRKFFDYIVITPDGEEILIDVKASTEAVKQLGFRGIIGKRQDGTYITFSGIPEKALGGRFFLEQSEAQNVAAIMGNILSDPDRSITNNN